MTQNRQIGSGPMTDADRLLALRQRHEREAFYYPHREDDCLTCGKRWGLHCDEDCDWPPTDRKWRAAPKQPTLHDDVGWLLARDAAREQEIEKLRAIMNHTAGLLARHQEHP